MLEETVTITRAEYEELRKRQIADAMRLHSRNGNLPER